MLARLFNRRVEHKELRNVVRCEQANKPACLRYRDRIFLKFRDSPEHTFNRIRYIHGAIISPHRISHAAFRAVFR
jgi:hypothetical protein